MSAVLERSKDAEATGQPVAARIASRSSLRKALTDSAIEPEMKKLRQALRAHSTAK